MTRGAGKEGLSRRHRFVGRGAFSAALGSSRKYRGRTAILHVAAGTTTNSRFGLAVAKRLARRAVERNRIKRLARESFRHRQQELPPVDVVINARAAAAKAGNPDIRASLSAHWDRIVRRCARS